MFANDTLQQRQDLALERIYNIIRSEITMIVKGRYNTCVSFIILYSIIMYSHDSFFNVLFNIKQYRHKKYYKQKCYTVQPACINRTHLILQSCMCIQLPCEHHYSASVPHAIQTTQPNNVIAASTMRTMSKVIRTVVINHNGVIDFTFDRFGFAF